MFNLINHYNCITDSALNVMFKSLNSPSKLSGWQSDGGDPCDDSWEGISCKGSAVTEMYQVIDCYFKIRALPQYIVYKINLFNFPFFIFILI